MAPQAESSIHYLVRLIQPGDAPHREPVGKPAVRPTPAAIGPTVSQWENQRYAPPRCNRPTVSRFPNWLTVERTGIEFRGGL